MRERRKPTRLRDFGLQSERLLWPTKGPGAFEQEIGVDQPLALDHDGRLAERLLLGHVAGNRLPAHAVATGRRSYAGGIPARTASCSRMIPSINASGRGGQPGT